jgi:CheY-like chemotaxis protein
VFEISLLLVGDLSAQLPPAGGAALGAGIKLKQVDDLVAAKNLLIGGGYAPDLILLAQSRPGQFDRPALDALRALAPLARIWRVLGSWCEGEARSGNRPPGCLNDYWHQWPARWASDLAQARTGNFPSWALPVTQSPEERALAAGAAPIVRRAGRIMVCARHSQTAWALADACRLGGYETLVVREDQPRARATAGAVAVVWDTDPDRFGDSEVVRGLRACAGGAPLVALVSFPRADDFRQAVSAGVAAVVSKPFLVHDLLWHVSRAVGAAASAVP